MQKNKKLNLHLILSLIYFIISLIVQIILMILIQKGIITNYVMSLFCIVVFSAYILFSSIYLLISYQKANKLKKDKTE